MNIVYIKIPKTASTYHCRLLEENYANPNNLKIFIPGREGWRDPEITVFPIIVDGKDTRLNKINSKFNLSARHLSYDNNFFDVVIESPRKNITSLREPLKRMISHYYCDVIGYGNRYGNTHREFNSWYLQNHEKVTLDSGDYDSMTKTFNLGFNNLMSYMLGYTNIDEITKESLNSKMGLILLTERSSESISLLSQFLGSDITGGPYKKVNDRINYKQDYKAFKPSDDVIKLFKENNKMDHKLYEIATEIFNDNIKKLKDKE